MKDEMEQLHQALALAETILRDGGPADGWRGKQYLVGMHAKWLTETEADQAMISFPGIIDADYYTRYLAQEANLVRFFLALHQANSLLVFEEAIEQFVAVEKVAELVQLITLGTRELQHYIFMTYAVELTDVTPERQKPLSRFFSSRDKIEKNGPHALESSLNFQLRKSYILYSPSLHTVFVDAFDVASVAYVVDGEYAKLALGTISQLAQVNGLYILS